jgi:DNA modification methylase
MGIHPIQKPLALFERPIGFPYRAWRDLLRALLGSGTQLIAAERLGRR